MAATAKGLWSLCLSGPQEALAVWPLTCSVPGGRGARSPPGTCHSRFVRSSAPAPAPMWSLSAARPGDLICHCALEGTANSVQKLHPSFERAPGSRRAQQGHRGSWAGGTKGAVSCGTWGGGGVTLGRAWAERSLAEGELTSGCETADRLATDGQLPLPGRGGGFCTWLTHCSFEASGLAQAPRVTGEGCRAAGRGWPGSAGGRTPGGLAGATLCEPRAVPAPLTRVREGQRPLRTRAATWLVGR